MSRNFKVSESVTLPNIKDTFDILKEVKNAVHNNFLLKSEISIEDPWPFIQDVEVDNIVVSKVKNFDYSNVFCSNPTIIQKGKGLEFKVSTFEVRRHDESVSEFEKDQIYRLFNPSNLRIEILDNEINRKQYLKRKIKRHRPSKDEDKLPENIRSLIRDYGDISANLTRNFYEKYCYFQKFKEYVTQQIES